MFPAVTLLALVIAAGPPSPTRDLLRAEGFTDDGPGALAYLESWVPDSKRQRRLQALVTQLGDDQFEKREEASQLLRKAGSEILADLRRAAETSTDLEVRRRARELLEARTQQPDEVVVAALEIIARTRPPQAETTLLRFAPHAPGQLSEKRLLETAESLGPTPLFREALTDPHPARRRLAVCALGQGGNDSLPLLRGALRDVDLGVRCEASRALVRRGQRDGLAGLVEAIAKGDRSLAWRAEDLLWRVAREQGPEVVWRTDVDRERCRQGWQTWLQTHGATVDLSRQKLDETPRGWIVVADDEKIGGSPGHVRIFDVKGQPIRTIENLQSPSDIELLSGDRLLLAEHWAGKVTERTADGKILWEVTTTDKPVCALRQNDGGTLIGTYGEILELDRTGAVKYSFRPEKGMLYGVTRTAPDRLVFINSRGTIFEADHRGNVLREFNPEKYAEGASYWASIEVLGPNRFLLSLSGADRVVEVNGQGKILWEATVEKPTYAQRLPDGNTLISCVDDRKYVVVNAAGKVIQTVKLSGRPFRARRY